MKNPNLEFTFNSDNIAPTNKVLNHKNFTTMKTILEQIQDVLNQASKFDNLDSEITITKFVDLKTNKEYDSIDEAFKQGVTDMSKFKDVTTKINPKFELNRIVGGDEKITPEQIQMVNKFALLVGNLDLEAEYNKQYTRLMNKKTKHKGNEAKLEEINNDLIDLKKKYGKNPTIRDRKPPKKKETEQE